MESTFREIAVEVYMDNIKSKLKGLDDIQLEILKVAFETGFNIGECSDQDEIAQAIALMQLSL